LSSPFLARAVREERALTLFHRSTRSWWVFGQLFEKGLVYRGLKVMPYSTACTTPLSNFEAGSDYRDVNDPAVVVAFPLVDDPTTSLLIWTTTPWTLPSNLGICAHPDFTYLKIHDVERNQNFIVHESLLSSVYKDPNGKDKARWKKVGSFLGKDMKGWRYEPLFDYFVEQYEDRAFRVVIDTYVTADSGTGLVHQAPAFGEDDNRVAVANGIVTKEEMPPCPLDDAGRYTSEVPDYEGVYVKDADKAIMRDLKARGRLIVQGVIKHSYPFCWRSKTPLIYKAIPVWMVRVEEIRDRLVRNNAEQTRWVPDYIGENRFGNWLKNARDWNISRNRYWGTPIPLWASEDMSEVICVSSVAELERLSGRTGLKELHRHDVDDITIPSQKTPGTVLRRIEEVFDCWFESGSMPYAQQHYPFENKDKIDQDGFPGDFICEGIDQTRGWFYTLLVLATHLFDVAPMKNVICTGLVMASDGKKMSKSLRNFPDPNEVLEKFGADAVRLYLVNSPVVRGDNLAFKEEGVKLVLSRVLIPWLNSFNFLASHITLLKAQHGVDFMYDPEAKLSDNVMDRWVLARCQTLIKSVHTEMDGASRAADGARSGPLAPCSLSLTAVLPCLPAYRLYTVIPQLIALIEDLTNAYIRFNRRRMKGSEGVADTRAALNTLFEALLTLCRTTSSFAPFMTETIYQRLRPFIPEGAAAAGDDTRSVHFLSFPEPKAAYADEKVQVAVRRLLAVINVARKLREEKGLDLKVRPLGAWSPSCPPPC
jgi:isoleucyl-tRNA synthetase